ncbi:DUF4397 domain-containing protein [Pseudoflavitalea rhizosphaerae]|uniref:DUF4397 domain-containing protein n=1 Tax=Pseudoflavitalea rhizosphaerae TaxID=1884793 RepID=UPI000F8D640D|nr:DUF4397 domain-containing protein [Pseudoflavitalea rhizosphaerae]
MKKEKLFAYISGLFLLLIITSCSKEKTVTGAASLTLVNGMVGSTPYLVPNFSGGQPLQSYTAAMKINYATYSVFNQSGSYSGLQPLAVYRYPDTTVHSSPVIKVILDLKPGTMNTLFLAGTITEPDTLFTTDMPLSHPVEDSTMGIRFVNLLKGAGPVSINVQGEPNGSEQASLAYKRVTPFTKYEANAGVSSYVFEFRDAATGDVLQTYTLADIDASGTNLQPNRRRYRNLTIVLMGATDVPSSQTVALYESYSPN